MLGDAILQPFHQVLLAASTHRSCSFCLFPVFQEVELRKYLVCKRTRHYKGWTARGTAKIEKTPGCKHNDAMPIWEYKSVHLRFDIFHFDPFEAFQTCHVNL